MNDDRQASLRKGSLATASFTVAHLINDSYPNLYPILLPELMLLMHFGTAAAGLISTVTSLTTQLLQPFTGYWADRIGGRRFVVGGLIVGSVLTALALALAPTYGLLLVALLLSGIGNGAFHPHASSIVGSLSRRYKGFGMSLFMIGGNLGRALAPVLAAGAFLLGGRIGLLAVAIPGLVMAGVMSWVLTPPPPPNPKTGPVLTPEFMAGMKEARNLLVVVGLRSMTTLSTLTLIPIWWKSMGRPMTESATMLSLLFIVGSLGNIAGGGLSDLFGAKPVLIGSAVFSSLAMALFLATPKTTLSLVLVALLGGALYATGGVVMVFSQALFPNNRGMASGLTLGIGNTLGALGVSGIGVIADWRGPAAALWVTAVALILSVPFVLKLRYPSTVAAGRPGTPKVTAAR